MATNKNFIVKNGLDVSGTANLSTLNLTGALTGPASFTIDPAAVGDNTGTVIIAGNLQVDGTQTTINSTTMTVDDLNITLASGAANAAAANNAGLTIAGAGASMLYLSSGDEFRFNRPLYATHSYKTGTGATFVGQLTNSGGKLRLQSDSNRDIEIGDTNNADIVYIDTSEQHVGIGVSAPSKKLHIEDSSSYQLQLDGGNNFWNVGAGFSGYYDGYFLIANNTGDKLVIDPNGNVGIGTPSPGDPLHVQFSNNTGADTGIIVKNTNTGTTSNFAGVSTQAVNGSVTGTFSSADYDAWGVGTFAGSQSNHPTYLIANNAVKMTITSAGNVGIGTTTPGNKFTLYDDGGYWATIQRGNSTPGGSSPWLGLFNNINIASATYGWGIYDSSADGSFQIWNKVNNTTGYNTFTILRGGNVGIGKINPGATLDIEKSSGATLFMNDTNGRTLRFRTANSGSQNTNISSYSGLYLGGSDNANHVLIAGDGNVTVNSGVFTTIHDITTVNKFKTTNSNTRSIISMESKDPSGNAVDLRLHALGDGPRGEIYTYTNHPLAFATNNAAPQMTLDTGGRLGINQTPLTNNFTLQVKGIQTNGTDGRAVYVKGYGTQTSIGGTGPTVAIQNANNTVNNYTKLSFESAGAGETVSINSHNRDHSNHYGDMVFNTRGSGGYSEKMRIMANGKIGIGTDGPTTTLQVNASGGGNLLVSRTGSAGGLYIESDGTNGVIRNPANSPLLFQTNGANTRMTILGDGNVGIGTPSPTTLLHINKASINSDVDMLKISMPSWSQSVSKLKSIVWHDGSNNVAAIGSEFDGGKVNLHFHSQYNGGYAATSTKTMSILGNGNVCVSTSSPQPSGKLTVNGGIRFNHFSAGHGLNCVANLSFNNSNIANACGSVYYKMFILNLYHNNGHSQALFLANGGGGVGFRFTVINAGEATIRNGIVDFNLTTIGSSPNTFRIQISNGGGALTVSRTSGSGSFGVSVMVLAGG